MYNSNFRKPESVFDDKEGSLKETNFTDKYVMSETRFWSEETKKMENFKGANGRGRSSNENVESDECDESKYHGKIEHLINKFLYYQFYKNVFSILRVKPFLKNKEFRSFTRSHLKTLEHFIKRFQIPKMIN